jgi:hypothetical protein
VKPIEELSRWLEAQHWAEPPQLQGLHFQLQEPPPLQQIALQARAATTPCWYHWRFGDRRKIARHPASTVSKKTSTADVSGGKRLHYNHRAPLLNLRIQ